MAKKITRIEDPELRGILQNYINNSLGFLGGTLSAQREKALDYYQGDSLGNEIDGRSQVVSTDVADTVESLLPNLLRVFTASDKVVICEPVRADDAAVAEQATAYLNHIFYKENDGFQLLYNFFKDALLEKNGILKVYYDKTESVEYETYENLTDEEYAILKNDPNVETTEHTEREDEAAAESLEQFEDQMAMQQGIDLDLPLPMLHNCKLKRITKKGKIKVESVPPEEFLIDKDAVKLDEANYVAHRVYMTRSELVSMGFDKDEVYNLPASDSSI